MSDCVGCKKELEKKDDYIWGYWHGRCLEDFKDEVYNLLGLDVDCNPELVYNSLLEGRECLRNPRNKL